tara:strand:- start:1803 stop:1928 length:126 start_codon:yes stop_codon:yes gene_type:complete
MVSEMPVRGPFSPIHFLIKLWRSAFSFEEKALERIAIFMLT